MIKYSLIAGVLLVTVVLIIGLLGTSNAASGQDFDESLKAITTPFHFSIGRWEFNALEEELGKFFRGQPNRNDGAATEVTDYFNNNEQIIKLNYEIESIKAGNSRGDLTSLEADLSRLKQQNCAAANSVENILERQITKILAQQGIFNPLDRYLGLKIGFPPVNFKLAKPPNLLVISPRDKIESLREIVLLSEMSLETIEDIENAVDKLGYSSLIVGIGGMASYPSLVMADGDLQFTINAVLEEWVHQYLTFKPLGFRYLLDVTGINRNYDIATIDETTASMVSKELGANLYNSLYAQKATVKKPEIPENGFDFNQVMRETRKIVDNYLARGEIEQAETFMKQEKQFLVTKGYYIRKLNQAYFAYYGTYADEPTSISPIGQDLKKLRSQSASLKDFLDTVGAMTSRKDLANSVK